MNTTETSTKTARKPRVPAATAAAEPSGKKITTRDMSAITRELNEALATIGKKHHVALGAQFAHLSKRGKLNIVVRGESGEETAIKKTKVFERRRDDETLPEYRMRLHSKQVGLDMGVLHQKFKIAGKEYEVVGLRGKAHKVLLQNTKKPDDTFEMLPSVFIEKTQQASA